MAQEALVEVIESPGISNTALIICNECTKLVPRTMTCIYCGAPILFKTPPS